MDSTEDTNNVYEAYCYDCDTEFAVIPAFDLDEEISFCPYCGTEIEQEGIKEEDDDFNENDDYEEDLDDEEY